MPPTERDTPQSVLERASLLLSSFSTEQPTLTLAELTRACGLPRSTVHRMAEELSALGWLDRTPAGYQLGIRMFEMGELVPRHRTLSELALPYMESLRTATGATVHLAVLEGVEVLYIQVLAAKLAPAMNSRRGGRLPAHATGVGKAMLAFSSPAVQQAAIDTGLPRLTTRTIATAGHLRRELESIRATGVAYDREESNPGVLCAAAPVFRHGDEVVGALSVSGFNRRAVPRMVPAVQTAALSLSRDLNRRDSGTLRGRRPR